MVIESEVGIFKTMKRSGHSYANDKLIEISIEGNRIQQITPLENPKESDFILGPGFTDLQINGFGGIDYNEVQADPLRLASISRHLYKVGVTSHLPTVITNHRDRMSLLIKQVVTVRKQDELSRWSIAGLHLEGPFISPVEGPRGAHLPEFVSAPVWDWVQRWQEEAEGSIKMITLSPEWENVNEVIAQCVKNNILVAIGHTNATHQQIRDAVNAGARLSTHLGNGMHQMIARHPNYLWSQLADERLSASVIADGFHLPPEVIQIFRKVKQEKLILISDSTSLAGMPPGDYRPYIGGEVTLTNEGRLHIKNHSLVLAGSASNLLQGVSFLAENNLVSLTEAWNMASLGPQTFLNPGIPVFEEGGVADLISMKKTPDGSFEICETIKNGTIVYKAE